MENEPKNIGYTPGEQISEQSEENHTLPLPEPASAGPSRFRRLRDWYISHKKWTIPATVVLFLLILAAIPFSRYKAAGVVIKQDFSLKVVDSATKSPVSDALVSAGSISTVTDGNGRATLKGLPVGSRSVMVTKKYYKDNSSNFLVPILSQKDTPAVSLTATGRQVKVKINNYVTKKPLAKVSIKTSDIEATSDKDGQALLVLPANSSSQEATLKLDGYNQATVNIIVSEQSEDQANTFVIVPSGKIYFMSKRTGKLDLMKSNIDGTDPQVVLAGTGTEQDYRTSLVQSPDSKFVALLTKRNASDPTPQLYLVSSEDDKLKNVDSGDAEFYVLGWAGNNLIYTSSRNDLPNWQQGKHKLKSYDAINGKITLLDQSAGTDEATNIGESYANVTVVGDTVFFAKNWAGYSYSAALTGKQHSMHTISSNGQNHRTISTYDAAKYNIQYRQHSPIGFYIMQTENTDKTYLDYSIGGQPKQVNLDDDKFYESYSHRIISPAGNATLWSDFRDGKDVVLVGDSNGNNSKIIASLDDYSIQGWFLNDYILLSKKNSELYIMGATGGEPVKVTNYQSVNGAYRYY